MESMRPCDKRRTQGSLQTSGMSSGSLTGLACMSFWGSCMLPFGGLQLISGAEQCFGGGGPSGSRPLQPSGAITAAAALHSTDALLAKGYMIPQLAPGVIHREEFAVLPPDMALECDGAHWRESRGVGGLLVALSSALCVQGPATQLHRRRKPDVHQLLLVGWAGKGCILQRQQASVQVPKRPAPFMTCQLSEPSLQQSALVQELYAYIGNLTTGKW